MTLCSFHASSVTGRSMFFWLLQAVLKLTSYNTTAELTKYNYVVCLLSFNIMVFLNDFLENFPTENSYSALKLRLLALFSNTKLRNQEISTAGSSTSCSTGSSTSCSTGFLVKFLFDLVLDTKTGVAGSTCSWHFS